MAYTFTGAQRFAQADAYTAATSFPIVVGLMAAALAAVAAFMAGWWAAAWIAAGISSLLALSFVFAHTWYPYRPLTAISALQDTSGTVDISPSADMDVVVHLTPDMLADNQQGISRLLAALLSDSTIQHMLERLQFDPQLTLQALEKHVVPHMTWPDLWAKTVDVCRQFEAETVSSIYVFAVFLLHPQLHAWLRQQNFREDDIVFLVWWSAQRQTLARRQQRWWDAEQFLDFQGVGLSWASGFTPFVDRFSHVPAGNVWDTPLFHTDKVDQLINTLARDRDSNVVLVGQPGVGRLGVIKALDARIRHNQAHPKLNNERLVYIHIGELLGLAANPSEQYAIISRVLSEMERAGNNILVMDGLGSILGEQGEGRVNITDALVPFFSSATTRVVVIMSNEEYHLRVKANEELIHFFEVIQIPELTGEQTLRLLALLAPSIEQRNGVFLPYRTLRELVENTESILPEIPFPEKAFDVLEEAMVFAQSAQQTVLMEEAVNTLISRKVGINIGQIKQDERAHLLQLDELIHQRVVNQEAAVAALAQAMIRARAGVRTLTRPIGTFLFLGPTGVGKTETAKALAEVYFGSEAAMQRLDMSEFHDDASLARLIGDAAHPNGQLTTMVSDHPFAVFLLDEFEKASLAVQQLFLQVLDEGYVHDARGHTYSFKHAIIIATSNAGSEFIRQTIEKEGQLPDDFERQLRDHILQQGTFRPELLNRFDGVITFTPLSAEHIRQIAALMLKKLNARLDSEQGITVAITPQLLDFLVSIGYDPEFGARPMARAIQNTVEYAVAQRIVRGDIAPGEEITLNPDMFTTATK
jgi:ATP-dependent Clp protease ATP-binding subunit ClpC